MLSGFLVRAYLFLYNPIRVIGLVLCSRSLVLIASISGRKETNQVLNLMKVTQFDFIFEFQFQNFKSPAPSEVNIRVNKKVNINDE